MQDPRMLTSGAKPRVKKVTTSRTALIQLQGNNNVREAQQLQDPVRITGKSSKRPIQQQEWSNSDSLPDSSSSGSEYRVLRKKYLLLEEENCGVGRELQVVEKEVKSLEDEKIALLDQLVVLEGLIDPHGYKPF
ncbi:uncharacterized protein LOC126676528 [Mercurialis annua]|uniref:uncharacterized protein LOC126676528 n=1 Tax=Mercurialis annua TaxID=3986 RepID=UPI00215F4723|nr:uncharacterized protein LOC126676528 [Mercurialis annua]